MERKPEESFEEYKVRRAAANKAVKNINANSKGGKKNTRADRPRTVSYAENLRSYFASNALRKLKDKK